MPTTRNQPPPAADPVLTFDPVCETGETVTLPAVPTWSADVAPIVADRCLGCHVDGGIAPFPLDTAEIVAPMAPAIAATVEARRMPPWPPGTCEDCPPIQHDRGLTDTEIAVFRAWSDAGAPLGDGGPAPEGASLPALARVDASPDMGADYTPPASPSDTYRCFVTEPPSTTDTWLTGYNVRPGEGRVVHHVLLFAIDDDDALDTVNTLDADDPGLGYECFGGPGVEESRMVAAWAPGTGATIFPSNTGLSLPGGRNMVIQMHYNVASGTLPDRTAVDLMLEDSVAKPAELLRLSQRDLSLEPGSPSVTRTLDYEIPAGVSEVKVYAVAPHMHALGKSWSLTVGDACVMDVPAWDFHWQGLYFFESPVSVAGGDVATMSCTYDTTSASGTTEFGENTTDEMCMGFVYVTVD